MGGYQSGDGLIQIGGCPYTLRLTLGALAELSSLWSASGPMALAQMFRRLTPISARTLLACLLRPVHTTDADRLAAELSEGEMTAALKTAWELIIGAFDDGF